MVGLKILVLGCGNVGSAIVKDLAKYLPSNQIVAADRNPDVARKVAEEIGKENVSWTQADASKYDELVNIIKKHDLVVGALPGSLGYISAKACVDAKVSMVDISYMPENPLTLNEAAIKAGITIVPDCGVAPGLSNLLAGRGASRLDQVEGIHIVCGGLPITPVPPLGYTITWSVEGLIDEYMRPARIVEDGKLVKKEALSGLEIIEFPKLGKLEAFYTDGLRTLLETIKGVKSMWEKTFRYPGHVEKIKLLRDLGFFDEEPIDVENVKIVPKKVTIKLLDRKLRKPKVKDLMAMKVEVTGIKSESKVKYVYYLLDYYDDASKTTAMARTTGYTASVVAQLIVKGVIEDKGVIPPEKLGMNERIYKQIIEELEKRNIKITEIEEKVS
ncbi:MAG: saccharopine dehydrogenase C-terminal domain-containing protein [Candidatus Baldrarchaeota archaeon]